MADSVTLTIDGNAVTVPAGTLVVEAAKALSTDVPVYCYHPKLGPAGLCRICLVAIDKLPKLQIACNTVVSEGMAVHTFGEQVEAGRRAVMEFLLLNHPLDCPICDKGGECDLQDYSMAYGQTASRLADPKSQKPKAIDLGPTIVLDDERCIVCQRCSRFDEIITHERSLVVKDRGQRDVIATATGDPYRSNFSGNVTELCPVGALTSKTYRFKSRPWDNHRTGTTCTQCAVGCQLFVDERYGQVQRTMSNQSDDALSDGWLCDRGRYNIGFLSDERRIVSPLLRHDGEFVQIAWDDAIETVARAVTAAQAAGPNRIGMLGGGRLLSEELVLLAKLAEGIGGVAVDWRTGRQQHATLASLGGSYDELEHAEAIVVFGRPPSETAPVLDLRVRKAVLRHGARLVYVGDRGSPSFVPTQLVATAEDLRLLIDAKLARIAIVWDGIDPAAGDAAAGFARELAAAGTAVHGFVPGEQPNARGAAALLAEPGERSVIELAAGGELDVLFLIGANPMLTHPAGPDAVRAALERTAMVVALDLFPTASAGLATIVLPAQHALEKGGHTVGLAGDVLALDPAHGAPAGTLSDGEIFVALASELGIAIPDPAEIEAAAASPDLVVRSTAPANGSRPGSAGDAGAETGLRLAIGTDIFAGGGTSAFDPTIAALRPAPCATLGVVAAAALGARDGDRVDVRGARAMIRDLRVRVSDELGDGIVRVVDGIPEAPANGLADGEIVALENLRPAAELIGAAR